MRKTPAGGATRSRAATWRVFWSKAAGTGAACAARGLEEAGTLEPAAFGAAALGASLLGELYGLAAAGPTGRATAGLGFNCAAAPAQRTSGLLRAGGKA